MSQMLIIVETILMNIFKRLLNVTILYVILMRVTINVMLVS